MNQTQAQNKIRQLVDEIQAADHAYHSLDRPIMGDYEYDLLVKELEALEKDNQAKGAAIRERDAKDATRDAAKKAGAPDGDLIYRVLKGDIEYDDDGKPTNLKALIDDLKQTTPHLFKPATTRVDGGAGNGSKPGKDDMNSMIRAAAGRQ